MESEAVVAPGLLSSFLPSCRPAAASDRHCRGAIHRYRLGRRRCQRREMPPVAAKRATDRASERAGGEGRDRWQAGKYCIVCKWGCWRHMSHGCAEIYDRDWIWRPLWRRSPSFSFCVHASEVRQKVCFMLRIASQPHAAHAHVLFAELAAISTCYLPEVKLSYSHAVLPSST